MSGLSCATCRHIGSAYWGDSWNRTHHCGKSSERRRDAFRPSGDFADDLMSEFRKFYDASARQRACAYYEESDALDEVQTSLLQVIEDAGREGAVFKFFSQENALAGKMNGKYIEGGEHAFPAEPARGDRRYRITDVGKAALARKEGVSHG